MTCNSAKKKFVLQRKLCALFLLWAVCFIFVDAVSGRDFYKILGVPRNASVKEIKRRYRELSKQYHPDTEGGDADKFIDIRDAHEALTDEDLRTKYDKYGEEGLDPNFLPGKGGGMGAPFVFRAGGGTQFVFRGPAGANVFFSNFGNGGGGGGGFPFGNFAQQGPPRRDLFDDLTSSTVKKARRSTWAEEVENGDCYASVVLFYSPACSHCASFKKDFVMLSKEFNKILQVIAVNCSDEPSLCSGIKAYPTLQIIFPRTKKLSQFPIEQQKLNLPNVLKWLDANLFIRAVLLANADDFESWISRKGTVKKQSTPRRSAASVGAFAPVPEIAPAAPKLLYVTAKDTVPIAVRAMFDEFGGRIDSAVFFATPGAAVQLLRKMSPSISSELSNKTTGGGILVHITDIDTLSGESFPISTGVSKEATKTALSLAVLRILASATNSASPSQLTGRKIRSGICDSDDGSVCVLLLTTGPPSKPEEQIMKTLAETFRTDRGLRFFYVDAYNSSRIANVFGYSPLNCKKLEKITCDDGNFKEGNENCIIGAAAPGTDCAPQLIAWRPKRKRYAVAPGPVTAKNAEKFVDAVLNGIQQLVSKSETVIV